MTIHPPEQVKMLIPSAPDDREYGYMGENIWVTVIEKNEKKMRGILDNHPLRDDYKLGDEIEAEWQIFPYPRWVCVGKVKTLN